MSNAKSNLIDSLQIRLHELSDEYRGLSHLQKVLLKTKETKQ